MPLIREWAVGDDEERSGRLAEASDEALRGLRDAPHGQWDAINAYLDENITGDDPYEAIVLGYFSEAAMEARLLLEERGAA